MAGSVAVTYGGVLAVCRGLLALVSGGDVSFALSPEASGVLAVAAADRAGLVWFGWWARLLIWLLAWVGQGDELLLG